MSPVRSRSAKRQLQETLFELQETKDGEVRLTLLRHMRLLVLEAGLEAGPWIMSAIASGR
jgi:hypothetical protein